MKSVRVTLTMLLAVLLTAFSLPVRAADEPSRSEEIDMKEIIFEHIGDSYWWHITGWKGKHIALPLPVIVRGSQGWSVFSSLRLAHGETYDGYFIATEGEYKGKIVERVDGELVRPLDLSLTKTAAGILINSAILVVLVLSLARWYRRRDEHAVPRGFVGACEMFIMSIEDDIIRNAVGPDYRRYSPYLLTAFFFIFINNLMGLVPVFPGGANTTGNISFTLCMALFTFLAVNLFGNREYWKEIFWPEVPSWLKVPVPLMPLIELFGVLTKPFALMIRLFANIMAGHTVLLAITSIVFITASMGAALSTGMTFMSVVMGIFMNCLELLVAYIQAYVFTMLSAVFIGLSRPRHHKKTESTE